MINRVQAGNRLNEVQARGRTSLKIADRQLHPAERSEPGRPTLDLELAEIHSDRIIWTRPHNAVTEWVCHSRNSPTLQH
jgi:hypothetical protein